MFSEHAADLPKNHPGTPVKAKYQHCPCCHDHATTLQTIPSGGWPPNTLYCPNCNWSEDPPHDVADDQKKTLETDYQAEGHPPQIEVVPGALSTPGIDYELIPSIVWERLAKRFMLGQERKGDKAWNADSPNQDILTSRKFILNRLGHTVSHCLKLMDKIRHGKDLEEDDDAAAITWGGAFAICATEALIKQDQENPFP
jgi:hypothetical protein